MKLTDLIIIYLACGAPFAVYYFLQNIERRSAAFWLQAAVRFLFWVPFALALVSRNRVFSFIFRTNSGVESLSDARREAEIDSIKKKLEAELQKSDLEISIYQFRAIAEQYVGLTLEVQNINRNPRRIPEECEIFRITNHQNKKLAAACLYRRNRKRLTFHQTLARQNFFEIIKQLLAVKKASLTVRQEVSELFLLLGDLEAQSLFNKLAMSSLQTSNKIRVRRLEKDLWKPEAPGLSPANPISANLPVATVTANLPRKD